MINSNNGSKLNNEEKAMKRQAYIEKQKEMARIERELNWELRKQKEEEMGITEEVNLEARQLIVKAILELERLGTTVNELDLLRAEFDVKYPGLWESDKRAINKIFYSVRKALKTKEKEFNADLYVQKQELASTLATTDYEAILASEGLSEEPASTLVVAMQKLEAKNLDEVWSILISTETKRRSVALYDLQEKELLETIESNGLTDYQAEELKALEERNALREAMGEDIASYYRSSSIRNVSENGDEEDQGVNLDSSGSNLNGTFNDLEEALELVKEGQDINAFSYREGKFDFEADDLSMSVYLFQKGIQLGNQFENTFRHSRFEEGLNGNEVNSSFGAISADLAFKKTNRENSYNKNLKGDLDSQVIKRKEKAEITKANLESWITSAKESLASIVKGSETRKEAESISVSEVLGNIVFSSTKKYRMPFTGSKSLNFESPVTKEEALNALKKAKTDNQELLAELEAFKMSLIIEKFNSDLTPFIDAKDYVETLLDLYTPAEVVLKLKDSNCPVSKDKFIAALRIAKNYKYRATHRFTKEEYAVISKAGIRIPGEATAAEARKRERKIKTFKVSDELVELVKAINSGDLSKATRENAQAICEAAAKGEGLRLGATAYKYVKSLIA